MTRVRVVAIMVLLASTLMPIEAQEENRRVYLDSGPTRSRGLRFLPVNVIEHYRGEYTVPEGVITVYFTEQQTAVYPTWSDIGCAGVDLLRIPHGDNEVIVYLAHDRPWELFVTFPAEYTGTCRFVQTFVARFLYFLQADDQSAVPPFPAILELR